MRKGLSPSVFDEKRAILKSLKKVKKSCEKRKKTLDKKIEIEYYIQALFECV